MSRRVVTRRELIGSAAVAGAFAAVPPAWARGLLARGARVGPGAFRDGVASGEPGQRAVTFWSRLQTDRRRSGARLVIARDEDFRRVVATAIVPTGAGLDGALKTRVGGLRPDTEYFYLWESGSHVSPTGRTRTAPAAGSGAPVRIGFSSCQNYAEGHFGAHAHAASVADLGLYVFLGDYIYERARVAGMLRPDRIRAVGLSSYRRKYRLYRSDPALRELHRLHPVAHIWDDHEVANNYSDGDRAMAAAQRSAGYRASFEWLPQMAFPPERYRIYKRLPFGAMADVFLLDERQYRVAGAAGGPQRILGDAQMRWLINGLRRSKATWKIIAQQVVVANMEYQEGVTNADAWDGFADDRARLLGAIERAGIDNVVFLTGDAHVFMANLLGTDFPAVGEGRARPAATEYVGGSVTSLAAARSEADIQRRNPWNRQFESALHGYAHLDLAGDRLVTEYRTADTAVPDAPVGLLARFVQPAGANTLEREPPPA